jgi:uncharacterized protein YfeS
MPAEYDLLIVNQIIALKRNKGKDAKVLGILQNVVTNEIFLRISNEVTSKVAYDVLQVEFRESTKVRAIKLQSLRRNFKHLKIANSKLLKDYITKVLDIVNQMKAYGEKIAEERLV